MAREPAETAGVSKRTDPDMLGKSMPPKVSIQLDGKIPVGGLGGGGNP